MHRRPIEVKGATVPFFVFESAGLTCYFFDTTECECPEPMVNAMHGLRLLDAPDKRLVMRNMQEPAGLYPRIAEDFSWEVQEGGDGNVEITFRLLGAQAEETDFTQLHCHG